MTRYVDRAIHTWHVVISGFLQTEGRLSGMVELWNNLRHKFVTPHTGVELRSWCSNWSDVAEMIWRTRGRDVPTNESPIIKIFAYSWGGYSAMLLARELQKRGLDVEAMVLSDAVYRHRYTLGQWRAIVPWSKIVVPSNVKEVWWMRQQNPRVSMPDPIWQPWTAFMPAGHDVVPEDPNTIMHGPTLLRCSHVYADDATVFMSTAMAVAEKNSRNDA